MLIPSLLAFRGFRITRFKWKYLVDMETAVTRVFVRGTILQSKTCCFLVVNVVLQTLPNTSASFSSHPSVINSSSGLSDNVIQTNVRSKRQDVPSDDTLRLEVTTSDLILKYGTSYLALEKHVQNAFLFGGFLPPPFSSVSTILSYTLVAMLKHQAAHGSTVKYNGEVQHSILVDLCEKQYEQAKVGNSQLAEFRGNRDCDEDKILDIIQRLCTGDFRTINYMGLNALKEEVEEMFQFMKTPDPTTGPLKFPLPTRHLEHIRGYVNKNLDTIWEMVSELEESKYLTTVKCISLVTFLFHFNIARHGYMNVTSATNIPNEPEFQAFEKARAEIVQQLWNVRRGRYNQTHKTDIRTPLRDFVNLPEFPVMDRTVVDGFYKRIEDHTTPLLKDVPVAMIRDGCKDFLTTGWILAIGLIAILF